MKIEFIADGSQDCPLLLVYGRETAAFRRLAEALQRLADGASKVDVHDALDPISPERIRLSASVADRDIGVVQVSPGAFEWQLTSASWDNVAGLLEPFWREPVQQHIHQCFGHAGGIRVVVSTDRSW